MVIDVLEAKESTAESQVSSETEKLEVASQVEDESSPAKEPTAKPDYLNSPEFKQAVERAVQSKVDKELHGVRTELAKEREKTKELQGIKEREAARTKFVGDLESKKAKWLEQDIPEADVQRFVDAQLALWEELDKAKYEKAKVDKSISDLSVSSNHGSAVELAIEYCLPDSAIMKSLKPVIEELEKISSESERRVLAQLRGRDLSARLESKLSKPAEKELTVDAGASSAVVDEDAFMKKYGNREYSATTSDHKRAYDIMKKRGQI